VSTVAVFATVLQAAGVVVDDVPDEEGVLSARFAAPARRVLKGWVPVDADAVVPRARRSDALVGAPTRAGRPRAGEGDRDP
jgi:hypothetical protein